MAALGDDGQSQNRRGVHGEGYRFITIENPTLPCDRQTKRLAQSHAVARSLAKKRKLQQKTGQNFYVASLRGEGDEHRHEGRAPVVRKRWSIATTSATPFPCASSDPFQMLIAESPRLQALYSAATEQPSLSISDELVVRNFGCILKAGVDNEALLNAFMLMCRVAAAGTAGGALDAECLGYQGRALRSVRQRMDCPEEAASESTIGAMVLLASVEARLGMPRQVQLHMGAISQLLNICRSNGVHLSDGIKRAIFWSDLNASVQTGSARVVDHNTFPELLYRRDPFSPASFFALPPGFQSLTHLLDGDLVEVLRDIGALQCIRESAYFGHEKAISMANIDNHQASIQSRLVGLAQNRRRRRCSTEGKEEDEAIIVECCKLAAYLCSTMLRCKIWRSSTIPSHFSLQLLCRLQIATEDNSLWEQRSDLLAWLLYMGGAFAPKGPVRLEYMRLLHLKRERLQGLYTTWSDLLVVLKQFIWSEKAFEAQVKMFWDEVCG